jgi:hypothetical protein
MLSSRNDPMDLKINKNKIVPTQNEPMELIINDNKIVPSNNEYVDLKQRVADLENRLNQLNIKVS